eukprot:scaffold2651_cov118-Isochrysis_galbana.AAC.8
MGVGGMTENERHGLERRAPPLLLGCGRWPKGGADRWLSLGHEAHQSLQGVLTGRCAAQRHAHRADEHGRHALRSHHVHPVYRAVPFPCARNTGRRPVHAW